MMMMIMGETKVEVEVRTLKLQKNPGYPSPRKGILHVLTVPESLPSFQDLGYVKEDTYLGRKY